MAETSTIEWTDATWNPVTGCSVISPGCTNCYAMKLAGTRLKHQPSRAGLTHDSKAGPVWNGAVRLNRQWLTQPLDWKRPRMIFVCAHGDLFHDEVPDEWIDSVFGVMEKARHHTFQVLTKRPKRMRDYMRHRYELPDYIMAFYRDDDGIGPEQGWQPPRNVWLGCSAEDQERFDERRQWLAETPAYVKFWSIEPMLGSIDMDIQHAKPDWVIVGGESGKDARPMHPAWPRSIRDQCATAGVPFFFKQWGEWLPDFETFAAQTLPDDSPEQSRFPTCVWDEDAQRFVRTNGCWDDPENWIIADDYWQPEQPMTRYGKRWTGRYLEGVEHNGMPEVRRA